MRQLERQLQETHIAREEAEASVSDLTKRQEETVALLGSLQSQAEEMHRELSATRLDNQNLVRRLRSAEDELQAKVKGLERSSFFRRLSLLFADESRL